MSKLSITSTIKQAYEIINFSTLTIKTILLGSCSEIERYLHIKLNIDVHKPIEHGKLETFFELYPFLKGMTLDQVNRLLILFVNVRNNNAHLHVNRDVFIDKDLIEFLARIANAQFIISSDNRLTIYGCFYLLTFLGQKYQLWHLCSSLLRSNLFLEIDNKTMVKFQTDTQHYFQNFCGVGKPIYGLSSEKLGKTYTQFINELNKKYLTDVFFDLELIMYDTKQSKYEVISFVKIIYDSGVFAGNPGLAEEVLQLRNLWFHGTWITDIVKIGEKEIAFDLEFIFDILYKIKTFLHNKTKFVKVIKDIHDYAKAIFDFFAIRIVEISYKILDSRLLTAEKIESWAIDSANAFNRLMSVDITILEKAELLLASKENIWIVSASKLSDLRPRKTITECLKIYQLKSESGFKIGTFYTNVTEIAIAVIDIDEDFENKINDKHLKDYFVYEEINLSQRIKICKTR